MALDQVEDVVIEADGVFKYILIELIEHAKKDKPERKKTVVRGFEWAEFHGESYKAEDSVAITLASC